MTLNHRPEQSPTADAQDQTIDELFDALRAERRRTVLSVLSDRERRMDLESLAEAVVAAEDGRAGEDAVQRTRVRLYHVHLPKLDDADLVAFDRDDCTVAAPEAGFDGVPIEVE